MAAVVSAGLADVVQVVGGDVAALVCAIVPIACGTAATGLLFAGVLLLSNPEPRELPEWRWQWSRLAFRWGWLPGWGWTLGSVAKGFDAVHVGSPQLVWGALLWAPWVALCILYMATLASLVTARGLRQMSWLCLGALAVALVSVLWWPAYVASVASPATPTSEVLTLATSETLPWSGSVTLGHVRAAIFVLAMVLLCACMEVLFILCWRTLRDAARDARKNWSRPLT